MKMAKKADIAAAAEILSVGDRAHQVLLPL